jgi:hypothetical protein
MSAKDVELAVTDFVNRARRSAGTTQIMERVDEGLARLQSYGLSKNDAINMLKNGIAHSSVNKADPASIQSTADDSNLLQVFSELDKRQKTP